MQFTAEMIAGLLNGTIVGDKNATVSTVSSIDGGKSGSLAYLTNAKYEQYVYTTEASIVLVDNAFEPKQEVTTTLIKVANVGECVLNLLEMYNATRPRKTGISKLASINEAAEVGDSCYVGDFTVIEAGAKVGANCQIYPQCYIGDNVTIGEGTKLYPGVKIYEGCVIGKNCILHAGVVIGADGFGFAPRADGTFAKIPQLGNVIIEDNVELGANTCIDRAKTDSTIVRHGVKLDNLIQIGHNVEIGANTLRDVHTCNFTSRCDFPSNLYCKVSCSTSHIKNLQRTIFICNLTYCLLSPAFVDIKGENMIQSVIVRSNIVKQFPDSFFLSHIFSYDKE